MDYFNENEKVTLWIEQPDTCSPKNYDDKLFEAYLDCVKMSWPGKIHHRDWCAFSKKVSSIDT